MNDVLTEISEVKLKMKEMENNWKLSVATERTEDIPSLGGNLSGILSGMR